MSNILITNIVSSDNDILLTFPEAMSALRVSRSTLYRLIWSGQLPGHKVGTNWRFFGKDVQAVLCRVATPATIAS